MPGYLTKDRFKLLSAMPPSFIDELEARAAGFVDAQLELYSADIDSRLAKRYAIPFAGTAPLAVQSWLTRLVTLQCWLRRGVVSTDSQFVVCREQANEALAQIKEAADSDTGLYDLPLIPSGASGITKSGPKAYSEQSPYVWTDAQYDVAVNEDRNRGGNG
jgi:hypothetical protein